MTKRSEMSWCSKNMLSKIFLVSVLLQISLGFDIFEEEKRQGLIPLARLGRGRLLATIDDRKASRNLIAYPRLGRRVFELHQTLIPYPRAGRLTDDSESLDYDILLNADYSPSVLDDTVTDVFLNSHSSMKKRGPVKLIPRIGRKKRSLSEGQDDNGRDSDQVILPSGGNRHFWNNLDGINKDYFFKSEKKAFRSKNALVPRIGKKSFDDIDEIDDFENKRAVAFTPRIGRASLIPRIGRDDPRFRLKSRGAFIPRIGRRAALIPRIGRSENQQDENKQSD